MSDEDEETSPSTSPEQSPIKISASNDIESMIEELGPNPRYHLVHNGKWKPKEYRVGRPIKWTGIWSRAQ
jgi:hypothetical protein